MSGAGGAPARATRGAPDPRVLVVMPLGAQLGGGEQMFRQLMEHGSDRGVEWIACFTQDGPLVAETRARGVETHLVPAGRMRALPSRWRATRRIAGLAREREVDLVLGWMASAQLLAGPAAWLAGVPAAWYQVGLPRPDWLDRVATRLPAAAVIVLSKDVAAAQARVRPRRPQALVHPGASLERFTAVRGEDPAALRARFGLPAAGPLIGIVGRLQRWKGMHTAIAALPAVRARHAGAHLVIVGGRHDPEPGYEAELRALVARLALGAQVTFAGFQEDVPRWMQAMDVVVHASDREPFGIVVVEAMALGKPVVAGSAGGPAEIITPGVDGLLAPFDDAPALAAALNRFLDEPAFAAACGAAAARRAEAFSAVRYAEALARTVRALARGEEGAR